MSLKIKDLKNALLEQLKSKHALTPYFEDLIEDYTAFWNTKNQLQKDIKKRGVCYEDVSSTGIKMTKQNPSTKELVVINKQMLTILKELKLTTDNVIVEGADEL